jgi:hypothetical protein
MVTRYQRGNQNLQIEEGQTTQWQKDTNGVAIVLSAPLQFVDSDHPFGIL